MEKEDEWVKCFSKTRKREYYFNNRTGESVWTLEEVNERIVTKKSNEETQVKTKVKETKTKISQSELNDKKDDKSKNEIVRPSSSLKRTSESLSEKAEEEDKDEPMDVDEVVENVKINKSKLKNFQKLKKNV